MSDAPPASVTPPPGCRSGSGCSSTIASAARSTSTTSSAAHCRPARSATGSTSATPARSRRRGSRRRLRVRLRAAVAAPVGDQHRPAQHQQPAGDGEARPARRGVAVRMLEINGVWEDHVRCAITAEEWRPWELRQRWLLPDQTTARWRADPVQSCSAARRIASAAPGASSCAASTSSTSSGADRASGSTACFEPRQGRGDARASTPSPARARRPGRSRR